MLALVALAFLVATGVGVPLLVTRLARGLGRRQLELRAELNARVVDDLQGVQDLLAFGREADREQEVAALNAGSTGCRNGWRSSPGYRMLSPT
jgi:ABC-type transport system involved in cytochrome bd biosynthesis fused ATPase/permease subunit